ncbi:hypothetical protein [Leptolyngbya sp. FACHB-60]|uniref:hypothetical protein n=1 Tax=Cyanophyceae TaxID=3028117 RepID=UPI00321FA181
MSPRKGFSCSHRVLHGRQSCSDYARGILVAQTLSVAIRIALPLTFARWDTAKILDPYSAMASQDK